MKIKLIEINKLYHPWIGGVESHVKDISEFLSQDESFHTSVICCNTKFKTETTTIFGTSVTKYASLGILFSLPISLSFIWNFKHQNADILHFHLPNPLAVIAYFLCRPKGKIVITWHSDIIKQKIALKLYKYLIHWFLKKASQIITTSSNLSESSEFIQPFKNKTTIIPLGIDPNEYTSSLQQPIKNKYCLFIGRLVYYKGVIELIQAIETTPITCVMIGDGPLLNTIKKKAATLIESKKLIILPPQKKETLNQYIKHCEFLVLPSTEPSEAFGIVQLEAMIFKRPVISTNLPTGVPFVNKHNITGLIVPPKNIVDLRQAMVKLWNDDSLKIKFGENAYNRVMTQFNKSTMITATKKTIIETHTNNSY